MSAAETAPHALIPLPRARQRRISPRAANQTGGGVESADRSVKAAMPDTEPAMSSE